MNNDEQQALEKLEELRLQARTIFDRARSDRRGLTDKERRQLDGIEQKQDRLDTELRDLRHEESNGITLTSQPIDGHGILLEPFNRQKPNHTGGPEYRALFDRHGRLDDGGFENFGEFIRTVHGGQQDSRLQPTSRATGMVEGVASDGGFLLPEQFVNDLMDGALLEGEVVRPNARVFPMTSETLKISGFDGQDHSGSLFGGVSAAWLAEGAPGTVQKPKFQRLELHTKKLAMFSVASSELTADAPNFDRDISAAFRQGIAFELDDAFLTGDGSGKPKGIANDAALVTVAKETSQTAATVNYNNIRKMYGRLHPALIRGARWVCHPSVVPELLALTLADSIVQVLREDGQGTLRMLGLPLDVSEKLQPLGTAGDIYLVSCL